MAASIPTCESLKSSPMAHRFGELWAPPGLTNFLGCVQSDVDPVSVRSLNFPPFACSDNVLCSLFVDGKIWGATGSPVTTTWYPDRIERSAEYAGLKFESVTAMAVDRMAVVVRLTVTNVSGTAREVKLKVGLRGTVTHARRPWNDAHPPSEADNSAEVDGARGAVVFSAKGSPACLVQGVSPRPEQVTPVGLRMTLKLAAGAAGTIHYVAAVGSSAGEALGTFDALIGDVDGQIERTRAFWDEELRAVFTPGNSRYSGHMPTLETSDAGLMKLYHMGVLGVIYFKRTTPDSVYGRAYTTLMPKFWQPVTFIWDYSLSSMVHAMLDPDCMKKYLELWMGMDIHKHFGTEYLTGAGVGPWYSVNDYALTLLSHDYLRWTGRTEWLDERVAGGGGGERVVDYLGRYATNYARFATKNGLADYGGLNNLLECVNTYLHEVASLNAANVFTLRTFADILEARGGEGARVAELREKARGLAAEVNKLYVRGKGYWHARFPDGSLREVRHVYDFFTTINTMGGDLSEKQTGEMVEFFTRELQTPTWLHALSCDDDDAMFSVRPDHQWTGAYPAWPPLAVAALYNVGRADLGYEWLKGLARSANQGPFGQAHFTEDVWRPEEGGAYKCPADFPYITDWTCSSNGSWCNVVVESIFGVRATLKDGLTARPQFAGLDPASRLVNVPYQGKLYQVTRDGVVG